MECEEYSNAVNLMAFQPTHMIFFPNQIPTGVPLLQGYGTAAFYLTGNISDDTKVDGSSLVKASQRKNFTSCCRKCKLSKTCKFFQFLNL